MNGGDQAVGKDHLVLAVGYCALLSDTNYILAIHENFSK